MNLIEIKPGQEVDANVLDHNFKELQNAYTDNAAVNTRIDTEIMPALERISSEDGYINLIKKDIAELDKKIDEEVQKANDKFEADDKLPHIIETYCNETTATWYKKYSNGWVEQGGVTTNSKITITFPVPFKDTNYTVLASPRNGTLNNGSGSYNVYMTINSLSKKSFYCSYTGGNLKNISWEAKGMMKQEGDA